MAKAAADDIDAVTDDAADAVAHAQDAIVNVIQEQPITSVIVALIVGVILGKLVL